VIEIAAGSERPNGNIEERRMTGEGKKMSEGFKKIKIRVFSMG
jgi:hypothetical protein